MMKYGLFNLLRVINGEVNDWLGRCYWLWRVLLWVSRWMFMVIGVLGLLCELLGLLIGVTVDVD